MDTTDAGGPEMRMEMPIPVAQALVDAGDEPWPVLREVLARCLERMALGHVLEVLSTSSDSHTEIAAWCHATGHQLLDLATEPQLIRFWIRKEQ